MFVQHRINWTFAKMRIFDRKSLTITRCMLLNAEMTVVFKVRSSEGAGDTLIWTVLGLIYDV